MKRILLMLTVVLLTGCDLTVGPKVADNIVFIRHGKYVARVAESIKVKVTVTDPVTGKVYTQRIDIGGLYLASPETLDGESK